MPQFYIINITTNLFHIDNEDGETSIGYETIMGKDLMLQLGLISKFKHNMLRWGDDVVHMKPRGCWEIGTVKSNLTNPDIPEAVIQNKELESTKE